MDGFIIIIIITSKTPYRARAYSSDDGGAAVTSHFDHALHFLARKNGKFRTMSYTLKLTLLSSNQPASLGMFKIS